MIAILLSFFLLLTPYAYAGAVSIPMGGKAPNFTLDTVDGKKVSLNDYKGKIVVLVYWRTDHKRSREALKDDQNIHDGYSGKGVQFLGMVADTENHDDVRKTVEDLKVVFPILTDAGRQVYGEYGVRVYPSTVVINAEGNLAYDIPGHALTYKTTLESYIKYLLKEVNDKELESLLNPHKDVKDEATLNAERNYNLALKFAESGLIDQSIDAVKKSVQSKPDMVKSLILLGFLYLEDREADLALEEFNKALKLEPASHDAKTGMGGALILKGDPDGAIAVLNEAVTANPYPQKAYYELGRAYELKGEKDMSIEMYKKALGKMLKKKILPSSLSK